MQVRRAAQNSIAILLEEEKGNRGTQAYDYIVVVIPSSFLSFLLVLVPIDVLLQQLCPTVKRCLGREENYDLRMDTTLVRVLNTGNM